MSIQETENEIIEEFSMFDDWMAKYEYLIDQGKDLSSLDDSLKTEDRLIKGCQSRVWLLSEFRDGKIYYRADSDAILTKGLVALMVRVLSGQPPEEIVKAPLEFVDKIGLKEHLSPTRSNGLVSMIKQMKLDAFVYQTKNA